MKILGIESSCDDTSISIIDNNKNILANETISQNQIHKDYKGVVPELAARNHVLYIDKIEDDGSIDNKHYKLTLQARDYFREENNCEDYDEDDQLKHKLIITAFAEEINDKMYIKGSSRVFYNLDDR